MSAAGALSDPFDAAYWPASAVRITAPGKPHRWRVIYQWTMCRGCHGCGEHNGGFDPWSGHYVGHRCFDCSGEGYVCRWEAIEPRRRVYRVRGTGRVLGRFRGQL